MKSILNYRILLIAGALNALSLIAASQTDKKSAELKNIEAALETAKERVAMNEKRVAAADSLINAGKRMISESKADLKAVDSDSRKLEKDYAEQRKPLDKLANSKDKATANKARADLRAVDTKYKTDNRALEIRLREATKKQSTGISNIQKGKIARKNAVDALKVSGNTLKAAQAKYDEAITPALNDSGKGKSRK